MSVNGAIAGVVAVVVMDNIAGYVIAKNADAAMAHKNVAFTLAISADIVAAIFAYRMFK